MSPEFTARRIVELIRKFCLRPDGTINEELATCLIVSCLQSYPVPEVSHECELPTLRG